MPRIFLTLSVLALLLMSAAVVAGLGLGDVKGKLAAMSEPQRPGGTEPHHGERASDFASLKAAVRFHLLLGVAAALAVILVNSIAVTYFIGTGRWCREVVEAYGLDRSFFERSRRLKRRSFPWAVAGMLAVLCVAALGAAADPGTLRPHTEVWVTPHLVAALGGLALIGWSFFAQWENIVENHQVIDDVVAEVARIRHERGLPV